MSDRKHPPETQRAINETLREIDERLQEEWRWERRQRDGWDPETRAHQVRSERMETYARAMKTVINFIRPAEEETGPAKGEAGRSYRSGK